MPNSAKPVLAWAIRAPNGRIADYTVRPSQGEAEAAFVKENPDFLAEYGFGGSDYRCVRVEVKEVNPNG